LAISLRLGIPRNPKHVLHFYQGPLSDLNTWSKEIYKWRWERRL
jgi:hypothetical protein